MDKEVNEIEKAVQDDRVRLRQAREKRVRSYPYPTLEMRHLAGAKLLPTRTEMLQLMPRNGCVCEVGVADGDFSQEILEICNPDKFHLVDAWEHERYSECYQSVCNRFSAQLKSGKVEINRGNSTEQLEKFPDDYFDWIYIDTVHDYTITAKELLLSLKKVKKGGIIAGHDYTVGNIITPIPYGVVQAVQEFCVNYNWKYLYLTCESHCHVSFAIQEI